MALTVVGRSARTVAISPGGSTDRSPRETPRRPRSALPRPEVRTLRCGIPLWVIPRRVLPIVAATFILGGEARRAAGRPSRAWPSLTANVMDEGTTTRSSLDLALASEGMGTHLSTSCGWDGSYVSLQCLAPHLPASLDLAVDVLRDPTFPASEFERVHGQTLAALRAEHDSAEARTYRGLLRALYDREHPYRLPLDGDEATVAPLSRDDLRWFHERYHGPSQGGCIVAGDVDPGRRWPRRLDERLAGWSSPRSRRRQSAVPDLAVARDPPHRYRPGQRRAVVRVGHVGLARLDPDFTDALVLNQILGGQFSSRLNTKLREEKGFTYGIRSQFDCRRGPDRSTIAALAPDRSAGRCARRPPP